MNFRKVVRAVLATGVVGTACYMTYLERFPMEAFAVMTTTIIIFFFKKEEEEDTK